MTTARLFATKFARAMGKLGPVDLPLNQWLTTQLTACSQGMALPELEQQWFKAFGMKPNLYQNDNKVPEARRAAC